MVIWTNYWEFYGVSWVIHLEEVKHMLPNWWVERRKVGQMLTSADLGVRDGLVNADIGWQRGRGVLDPSCKARGIFICKNNLNGLVENIKITPIFWRGTAGGISQNHLSLQIYYHKAIWYRLKLVHWKDVAFKNIFFFLKQETFYQNHM